MLLPPNKKRFCKGIASQIAFQSDEIYTNHIKCSSSGHDPKYPPNNWELQPTICKNLILKPKTSEKRNTTEKKCTCKKVAPIIGICFLKPPIKAIFDSYEGISNNWFHRMHDGYGFKK
jgi:hypothetical protein